MRKKRTFLLFNIFILSSFFGAFKFTIPASTLNLNVNISQIVFFILVLVTAFQNKLKLKYINVFDDLPSLFIFLYFISNLIPSLYAANTALSLKSVAVIFVYSMMFYITKYYCTYFIDYRQAIYNLLKYNYLSVLFGIASIIYFFIFKPDYFIGVSIGHLGNGVPSIRSLSFEPNVFGIITAACTCIYISLYLLLKKPTFTLQHIILSIVSIILSFTRSVYVSFALAIALVIILSKKVTFNKIFIGSLAIISILIVVLFSSNNIVVNTLAQRTENITSFEEGSGLVRIQSYKIGLDGFKKSPILGNGTMSANTRVYHDIKKEYVDLNGTPGWLTGFWIQSLNDSGLVGFIISIFLLLSFIRINYISYQLEYIDATRKFLFLGFFCANIVIAISTQISSVMWISFTYIFWGMNIAIVSQRNTK